MINYPIKPRVVVKVGSGSIATADENGIIGINTEILKKLSQGIDDLKKQGFDVIVVSSGAVAAGMSIDGLTQRPTDTKELGYLASVGQPLLMDIYAELLGQYGYKVAQVLPERSSYHDQERRHRMFAIRDIQLKNNKIVFINENDPVVGDELTFGDNDFVAALEAIGIKAKYLVLLTDQNGILSGDPRFQKDVELLEEIDDITPELFEMFSTSSSSVLGSGGGLLTKIYASDIVRHNGITPYIANVNHSDKLLDIISSKEPATKFKLKNNSHYDLDLSCEILDKIAETFAQDKKQFNVAKYFNEIEIIVKHLGIEL